jgi:hypothetical protein
MKMNQCLATVGAVAALCLVSSNLLAQNNNNGNNGNNGGRQGRGMRGGGPPTAEQIQQWQQDRLERTKTDLEITDDAEWKAIQPLVEKVQTARMAVAPYAGFGRGFGGRGRGGADNGGGQGGRGGFMGMGSNSDVDALQKAIDSKASNSEMKTAIAKFQDARKAKMAELEKAQGDLRKVLSVRQEAIATQLGLL